MTIDVSIILPCYNESGNIPSIIDKSSKLLRKYNNYEVIFVNNGSSDNTSNILNDNLNIISNRFKIVTIDKNIGYGHGIITGLNSASGKILAWTHADNQTDLFDIPRGVELLEKSNIKTSIKGKRMSRGLIDRIFTYGMQLFVKLYLGVYLDDINAQPKIIHKATYDELIKQNPPNDFSLDLFLLYKLKQNNIIIKEIDVYFGKREHGEAKGGGSLKTKLNLTFRTFKYILDLKKALNKDD